MEEIPAGLLAEFPERGNLVFFDHAAVSPITRRARQKAQEFMDKIADPSRINCPEFADEVEKSRAACAALINSAPENLCFVRSTSHGISIAASGLKWKTGENIVSYNREFPANIYPWLNLVKRGVEVRLVREREGRVPIEDIERLMNSQTRLVAVSVVQFTNGFRIDLKRLGELCRKKGVLLLVDAIQSLGVVPFDLKETPVDFLAADGHKWLLSFEGLGIFYVNPALLNSLDLNIIGWNSVVNPQEYLNYKLELRPDARRFEEGSYNVLSILALGASASLFNEAGVGKLFSRALEITNFIAAELEKGGSKIISPMAPECRSAILSVVPPNADLQAVNQKLRERGVVCSVRAGAIRLSPHGYQDMSDAEKFLQAWREAVA
jgi:cysteine desulfurase / selenocysteine lyase